MSLQIPKDKLKIDSDKLRKSIYDRGKARRVAAFNPDISPEQFKDGRYTWNKRRDNVYLRVEASPDNARYRSDFGYEPVTENLMFIKDALRYKHYDRLSWNKDGILSVDQQQRDLIEYFFQAEDRIFFGEDPVARAGGWTGIPNANSSPTPGTHASTEWGATAFDVSTLDLAMTTLGAGIGYLMDGMEDLSSYPLFLVITPDVKKSLLGLKDENGTAMAQMIELLQMSGNGAGAIIDTKWLGATVDIADDGKYDVTNGSSNAALMAWSPENYEVHTSNIQNRQDNNDVDGLRINMEEAVLPTFYYPESIVYEAGVTT